MGELIAPAVESISSFLGPAAEAVAPAAEAIAPGASSGLEGIEGIVGTGEGLFGGPAGLEGTLLASGAPGGIDAALGVGPTAFGTAESFLSAPGASGFNPEALTSGFPGGTGTTPTPGASVASLTGAPPPTGAPGTSVFDTGTSPLTGVSSTGTAAPTVAPAGSSASSIAAPAGVTAPVDPTTAAPAASAAGTAPASSTSSIQSLLGKAGGGAVDSLLKNPLGIALGTAGLGYNIFKGQQDTKNQQALSQDAATATANSGQMVASGEALQQYLTNGTLPPAYQQQVDQAIKDAKTTAISNAAQQGLPTDPTKNTALATELAKIDASRAGMQASVASQLFSSGSSLVSAGQSAAGLSGQLYSTLVNNDTAAAANTGKAIATLASALNGKSQNTIGNTTINTG